MLDADALVAAAVTETGLEDFGGDSFRQGLDRLVEALGREAAVTPLGEEILRMRLGMLLANRLRIEDVYHRNPTIDDEPVDGPLFIIGLPRTGTTALSQLLACDPQIRSLRLWESSDPVPPPEAATEDTDPRIAETAGGLAAMYETFPRMASLHHETATGPTECQDLLGMEFRTAHFDGMAHVPSYTDWVLGCDMAPAYHYHRRVLRLLQWHCPPRLWHLKTPVHMLALDALDAHYPDARFLWTHRAPTEVLGSVCSLVGYVRSWVSDLDDSTELGPQQTALWSEALRRAMRFRQAAGEHRFADVSFSALNADPLSTIGAAYEQLGLDLSDDAARRMRAWSTKNRQGAHGVHEYTLEDFGIATDAVREEFRFYTDRFAGETGPPTGSDR
ncbi:MAG TPA: sulfotransferase [Acidimicrobiales bacterium]|nr:sulfotransferase [Acidimicrobiales bacterium]